MKKLFLSLLGLAALTGASAADYTVYNNGTVNPDLHVYGWWNDFSNFEAADPTGGITKVFQFNPKEANGGASMGLNMEAPQNTGILANATLNFKWYAVGTGKYTVRLTAGTEGNYDFTVDASNANKWNTSTLPVSTTWPEISKKWADNYNEGIGYVFSIIVSEGSEDCAIYFDNIYYSNVDESWTPPVKEVVQPASVPTPTLPESDVVSVFSSAYTAATGFNIGGWGQTTNATKITIDGADVYRLRNFNYLGWELTSHINVSGCDYMHVDMWTAESTPFGFTPISPGPKEKLYEVAEVKTNEWNSYDVPLTYFSEAGIALADIFQIKFDKGEGGEIFIANVYFYKGEGSGENPDPDQPAEPGDAPVYQGTVNGSYTQTMDGEAKEYPYSFAYSITYNADKTLTTKGKFNWIDGKPVGATDGLIATVPGVDSWNTDNQNNPFSSTATFEKGTTVEISFGTAVALGNVEVKVDYVVGSQNDSTGIQAVAKEGNARWFGINGMEVNGDKLTPGIYIRVEGGKATKVIVR